MDRLVIPIQFLRKKNRVKSYKKKSLNDTVTGRNYRPADISSLLDYMRASEGESCLQGRARIYEVMDKSVKMPRFYLPFYLSKDDQLNPNKQENRMIIDNRHPNIGDDSVKRTASLLDVGWSDDFYSFNYLNLTPLPLRAYCLWVSRKLSTRFNFDPDEQSKVAILAGLFYLLQSKPIKELFSSNNLHQTIKLIAKAAGLNDSTVTDYLTTLEEDVICHSKADECPPTLQNFIHALSTVSPRLKETASLTSLMAVFSRDWVGVCGPHFTIPALEHPPMFIALLYTSIENQTYRMTTFSKLIKEYILDGRNRELGDRFVKAVNQQIKDIEESKEKQRAYY